jgi:hypothetical protein
MHCGNIGDVVAEMISNDDGIVVQLRCGGYDHAPLVRGNRGYRSPRRERTIL